jgi:glycerol kinase
MLFDIRKQQWDADLCRLFAVPAAMLPEVRDNDAGFGLTASGLFDRQFLVGGMAGDQQAALFGQCCFDEGMAKSTFGTGAFLLLNTGTEAVTSAAGLLTTPAYRIGGQTRYALEGSIFVAGAAIQWLRDGMGIIPDAAATERLAASLPDDHGVYLVPAFVGLGAPYWQPEARGTLSGLTLDSGPAHLARAALEAVAYQTLDVFKAMASDCGIPLATLKVDGGMSANGWLCQFLADVLGVAVERPRNLESSALGAAFLSGLSCGVWSGLSDLPRNAASVDRFEPLMRSEVRKGLVDGWNRVVQQAAAPLPRRARDA